MMAGIEVQLAADSKKLDKLKMKIACRFLIASFFFCIQCNGLSEEGQLLLQIKDGWNTDGKLDDWKNTSSPDGHCNWSGVTCDPESNSVVALKIPYLDIYGEIPPSFCQLSNLTELDLSWNYFGGTFPSVLFNCTHLQYLDLSQNVFVGALPEEIYKMEELLYLGLTGNNFSGDIPPGFGRLPKIEVLLLNSNLLNGTVPSFLGNMSSLRNLTMAYNPLAQGVIPPELGNLTRLQYLYMGACNLVGEIPESLGNMTDMIHMDLSENGLSGRIPTKLMALSKIEILYLYKNNLSGTIPANIRNLKNIVKLDLGLNNLNGSIPEVIGDLTKLEILSLYSNQLSGSIPSALDNLSHLIFLKLFDNRLSGQVSPNIGMNSKLKMFDVSQNELSGPLPLNVCKGGVLDGFIVFSNKFNGSLPQFLGNCPSLTAVHVHDNQLSGEVPLGLWDSRKLKEVRMTGNSFHGQIPGQISKAPSLKILEIGHNQFSGPVPSEIGGLRNMSVFVASGNKLSGPIPVELSKLSSLTSLLLDNNILSGELPNTMSWRQLNLLNLANNGISGSIPSAFGSLPALNFLDLSNNQLEGNVPAALADLSLSFLNVSGNHLSGPIPNDLNGVYYEKSFLDNPGLCGAGPLGLPSCSNHKKRSEGHLSKILIAVVAVAAIVCLIALGCGYKTYRDFKNSNRVSWKLTPFHRVEFDESDILKRLTEDNVIGSGGTGKVYKVILPNNEIIAVKKIRNDSTEQSPHDKQFEAEVDTLGKLRHVNIVKLLCCISSSDSKLLVYEYMSNGSLYDRLHESQQEVLEWPTRYEIAFGAAQGLQYMHHGCNPPIVHRDIKSNNILIDSEFTAHIADFGLARIVQKLGQKDVMSGFAGSYGYMAPEYAYTLKINEKCDIYSFGVVLLELVTGKKPNATEFGDGSDIVRWVRNQIQINNGVEAVLDSRIADGYSQQMICMLKVALLCTSTLPINRPSTRDVVEMMLLCNPDEQVRNAVAATLPPHLKRNPSVFRSLPRSSS